MSGGRSAVKAATILSGALLLAMLVSLGLNEISLLSLYKQRFAFEPGPWFVEPFASSVDRRASCIIVGASTAREGLDVGILGKYRPELTFVNSSTTGGNIEVAEIQAQIMHRYGIHARCIIVGLHPYLLMDQNPPFLGSTGYLSHLRTADVLSLSDHGATMREIGPILRTIVLPLKTHADRLNKLVRLGIFHLQKSLRTTPAGLAAYEYFEGEFRPAPQYNYDGRPHWTPDAIADQTQMRYRTYTYNSEAPGHSFRRALALFRTEADVVLLVAMPNRSTLRNLNAIRNSDYERAAEQAGVSLTDCSGLVPDEYFIDDVHLDEAGRRILSNAIGNMLASNLASLPSRISCGASPTAP